MSIPASWKNWSSFALDHFAGQPVRVPTSSRPDSSTWLQLGLGPLMYQAFQDHGLSGDQQLELAARNVHAVNILQLQRAEEVTRLLERNGITAVSHKGAAAIAHIPRYASIRTMADLDLLVRPDQFHRARCLLEAEGARIMKVNQPVSDLWSSECALELPGPALPLVVDLHRRLHHWPLANRLTNRVLDRAIGVGGLWVPPIAECLCIIALHRAKHGFRGDCRDLMDLALLMNRLDEQGFGELLDVARAVEILPGLYITVRLAVEWFGARDGLQPDRLDRLSRRLRRVDRAVADRLVRAAIDWELDRPLPVLPFLELYRHVPAATGRIVPAVLGALLHAGFRMGDVLVRGPKAAPGLVQNLFFSRRGRGSG